MSVMVTFIYPEDMMPRGRPRKTQGDILLKSAEMIGWAIGGLEREIGATRERLAALTAQANTLRAKLPAKTARGAAATDSEPMPAAAQGSARKRISDAQKKRWAERRKASK